MLLRLIPRPERDSPVVRLEKNEAWSAGYIEAVGENVKCGLKVGDLAIFHRGHLVMHKNGKMLSSHLKEITGEDKMILMWFDIAAIIEEPGSVEVDGVAWA